MTIDLRKQSAVPPRPAVQPASPDQIHAASSERKSIRRLGVFVTGGIALLVILYLASGPVTNLFFGGEGTEREARMLAERVSDHILLPQGETPTIATVSDMSALHAETFFKNAEEGDKVLMYMKAQKAILYRPSNDLIIEVGPITGIE